ncbi:MAG: pseudouridine synthase [Lachnospiraceae bacterium]|nr:pseudouridine synthase [Lachnospiraceae bacterium]
MEFRLNKYLSDAGICSRREADRIIEKGEIYVDNKKAVMGQKINEKNVVTYKGKVINRRNKTILLALNKPEGIESTTDKSNPDNIVDFVGYNERIYPIGRLDKNSEGLILLTNNGEISDKMMRASNYHEKEYEVEVDRIITEEFIESMSNGIHLVDKEHNIDVVTRKCKVEKIDKRKFSIVLTQGINRQIRRMCKSCGYNVKKLKRVRILNIKLDKLELGKYREITDEELRSLLNMLDKDKKFVNRKYGN